MVVVVVVVVGECGVGMRVGDAQIGQEGVLVVLGLKVGLVLGLLHEQREYEM